MNISEAINYVISKSDLSDSQMSSVMHSIMTGNATNAQIGGFLIGLRMKGETVTEITAAAKVMRDLASGVDIGNLPNAIDIVGTGGDSSGTFNISTACMFVAAAAGCHVAKHGNRSVSSKSGSADALEAAGVNLIPYPVDFKSASEKLTFMSFIPSAGSFARTSAFVREMIGRTYYKLKY